MCVDYCVGERVEVELSKGQKFKGVVTDVQRGGCWVDTDGGGRLQINLITGKVLILHQENQDCLDYVI